MTINPIKVKKYKHLLGLRPPEAIYTLMQTGMTRKDAMWTLHMAMASELALDRNMRFVEKPLT